MKPLQNTIALVYDFDGTLSPDNMQERTIFEHYKIDKDSFWKKAGKLVKEEGYERTLAYLKLLLTEEPLASKPLSRQALKDLAQNQIRYFEGVETFFERLANSIVEIPEVQDLDIRIEHYVISSGLKELLEGCSIYKYFKKVYACEYAYENDKPVFPKLVINDTNKTQFLFRINKGKLELSDDINSHMPEDLRPIPFRNMIYIGDGFTDIPSMTLTQRYGGSAIAVYPPNGSVPEDIKTMVADGRADHFAPADYREGELLETILQRAIQKIIQTIAYRASSSRSRAWVHKHR